MCYNSKDPRITVNFGQGARCAWSDTDSTRLPGDILLKSLGHRTKPDAKLGHHMQRDYIAL